MKYRAISFFCSHIDVSFLKFGPAHIAAASLFCAAAGIEGAKETVPVWVDIPEEHLSCLLGLVVHFSGEEEVSRFVVRSHPSRNFFSVWITSDLCT